MTSMPEPPLFLYGTLRDVDVRTLVLDHPVPAHRLQPAIVRNLTVLRYPKRTYPAIVRCRGASAVGLLLLAPTVDELRRLDAFEGDEYRRLPLPVALFGGPGRAQAYWPTCRIGSSPLWSLALWRLCHKTELLGEAASIVKGNCATETPHASFSQDDLSKESPDAPAPYHP